jgi:hypothetical protein
MLIKEEQLVHWIDHFYGYGSWEAKVWFIAHEESGGDLPEELSEKLASFFDASHNINDLRLHDIRALYKQVNFRVEGPRAALFKTFFDYRFGDNAVLHGTWKNLIAFIHGYQGKKIKDLLSYQQKHLAQPSARSEALIKLYPLPAHDHAWYYSWLDLSPALKFLKTRSMYQEHMYAHRIQTILQNIVKYQPEVVLMYGMENINTLKQSIQGFFPSAKFSMVKAIKQQIPQHHRTTVDGTTILLTTQVPSLRHNRIETGFDWEAVGKLV